MLLLKVFDNQAKFKFSFNKLEKMRIDDLQLFVLAARHGSLSAAGREIDLSPAAASARLTALEKHLGVRLIARSTRSLNLTEDGAAFIAAAEQALVAIEAGRAALSQGTTEPHGRLRATLPGPFGRKHILPFLPEFHELYPKIEIELDLTDSFVNLIEEGFDLGIRIGVPRDSTLTMTRFATNRRVIVATPDFIARHGRPETPGDCTRFDAVFQPNLRNWHFQRGKAQVDVRVSGPVSSPNGAAIHDAALLGLGIAMKSIWDVGPDLKSGRLVQLVPGWTLRDSGDIYAVRPTSPYTPPKVRAFIDFLKSKYGPKPYWEVDLD